MRHDKICAHLHYSIWEALRIEVTDKWYTHTKTASRHEDVTLSWNQRVNTDREVAENRPSVITRSKKR